MVNEYTRDGYKLKTRQNREIRRVNIFGNIKHGTLWEIKLACYSNSEAEKINRKNITTETKCSAAQSVTEETNRHQQINCMGGVCQRAIFHPQV